MKELTVYDLCVECKRLINNGMGCKKILISDDDEGNGFHSLFFGFTEDEAVVKKLLEYSEFHDKQDLRDVVLLG